MDVNRLPSDSHAPGRIPAISRVRIPVLVVALDLPTLAEAVDLVEALRGRVSWFKVGSALFTAAGPPAVQAVRGRGGRVFLDLKFHDIPRTVASAVEAAVQLGVDLLTVHVAAGREALVAAVRARDRSLQRRKKGSDPSIRPGRKKGSDPFCRPLLVGVTRLTSEPGAPDVARHVVESAVLARECGLDGVVAAVSEVPEIKRACGDEFIVVTPGIRPAGDRAADQRRTATPAEAVRAGADYLVVGRPIIAAPDPHAAAIRILAEMEAAARQDPPGPPRKQ